MPSLLLHLDRAKSPTLEIIHDFEQVQGTQKTRCFAESAPDSKIECLLPTLQDRRALAWRRPNWIRFLSGVIGGKIAVWHSNLSTASPIEAIALGVTGNGLLAGKLKKKKSPARLGSGPEENRPV